MRKIELSNKAKMRILIGVGCFVVALIVALSVPKNVYEKLFSNKDIKIEDETVVEKPTKLIYVLNKNDDLVGINLPVDQIEKDEIVQKWDLLTSKANTYPLLHYTPIAPSTKLNKYEILQNKLTLVLSEEFLNSDGKNAIASIAWTFCDDTIDEVVIKVDNNIINQLQDYSFDKIDRSINVNYVFETSYLFEADFLTILHNEGEFFKPVTYFFKDIESIDFMVMKLMSTNITSNNAYTYEIDEENLTISLGVDDVLSTEVIQEICETIKLNFDVEVFKINNNVMTLYEEDFTSDSVNGSTEDNKISNNIV